MKAMLQGISGPGTGVQASLDRGIGVSVGRNETCNVCISRDNFLSGRHFEVAILDHQVLLRDLGSRNGTFIQDVRIREHVLHDGDFIHAGQSVFQIQFHGTELPTVVDVLSNQSDQLYAVLDTARDPAIYSLLLASGASYWSLYAGKSARELEAVAPYLVFLPPNCDALQQIVAQGWSKSWGIFLTSSYTAEQIWHDLRHLLIAKLEESKEFVYFRFYDPRVLRVFIRTVEEPQAKEFAKTIACFILEDRDPNFLVRFHPISGGYREEKLAILSCGPPSAREERGPSLSSTQLIAAV